MSVYIAAAVQINFLLSCKVPDILINRRSLSFQCIQCAVWYCSFLLGLNFYPVDAAVSFSSSNRPRGSGIPRSLSFRLTSPYTNLCKLLQPRCNKRNESFQRFLAASLFASGRRKSTEYAPYQRPSCMHLFLEVMLSASRCYEQKLLKAQHSAKGYSNLK
jgi:hypothetical protein